MRLPRAVLMVSALVLMSTAQAIPNMPNKKTSTNKKIGVNTKVTIGMIQDASCGDYCYLTILRKDNNKTQSFMGTGDVLDNKDNLKKKYQGVDVKVSWHKERHYIPEGGIYQTDDMVDRVDVLK